MSGYNVYIDVTALKNQKPPCNRNKPPKKID